MGEVTARINFEKDGIKRVGDLGVGQLRGRVYAPTGLCPAESETQYKDPIKVLVSKGLGNWPGNGGLAWRQK